jgi:hypothetical protein
VDYDWQVYEGCLRSTLARAYIALCLVGFSIAALGCRGQPRVCACADVNQAVIGLERIAKRDWRTTTRTTLETEWPQVTVLPCDPPQPEPAAQPGLEAAAESVARCCEACELCGGAVMDEAPASTSLRMVDLFVCPRPLRSARAELQRLTQAVGGPGAKPTSTYRDDSRTIDGYSWISNGELFTLRVESFAVDGGWLGHFQVGRCRSEDVIDTWEIDRDVAIRVTRADVEAPNGKGKQLRFAYFTRCLTGDRACHNTELDRLWPTLRSLADRQTITWIEISSEDCSGSSNAFRLERSPEGLWKGGLWSPKVH